MALAEAYGDIEVMDVQQITTTEKTHGIQT